MTQIKNLVTSRRANQGFLDDNKPISRSLDALPSNLSPLLTLKREWWNTFSQPLTRRSYTVVSSVLCVSTAATSMRCQKNVRSIGDLEVEATSTTMTIDVVSRAKTTSEIIELESATVSLQRYACFICARDEQKLPSGALQRALE